VVADHNIIFSFFEVFSSPYGEPNTREGKKYRHPAPANADECSRTFGLSKHAGDPYGWHENQH